MSTIKAAWEVWHPATSLDRDAIRHELEEVLASPNFCNSKRYPALLRYVVETTLSGHADMLKERTLGIEVFHRPADYDTNADTVVRYTAGEVRKRLSLYYRDRPSRLQICLPAGAYVPEFLCATEDFAEHEATRHAPPSTSGLTETLHPEDGAPSFRYSTGLALERTGALESRSVAVAAAPSRRRFLWGAGSLAAVAAGAAVWRHRATQPTALDEFWGPMLREPGTKLICAGDVVFAPHKVSSVTTAGKDTEYPFVSMQTAVALGRISGLLEREGAALQVLASSGTALSDLRERSVILLGGYNNEWTQRLQTPLRYYFLDEADAGIADRERPEITWKRDHTQAYASADDYALVVRFRDTTTGSPVTVLAGIGRNGTEAAAQFVTSPHYMELLRERAGQDLGKKNIEAVLKIRVIEGKTGAPSIEAVQVW
jgi:hypothetical protein